MVPVAGKPVLEHNLEWLRHFGIRDLVINLHYLPEYIKAYFGDGADWGVNITYSYEPQLLGTAGAVRKVDYLFDETFFVWYGDNLSFCNLSRLFSFHRANQSVATIALYYREDPTSSGIVGFDNSGRINTFLEKPSAEQVFSHWVNASIYVLEPQVVEQIVPEKAVSFERDVFPSLLAAGEPVFGYTLGPDEGLWWIDTPEDLQRTEIDFSKRIVIS
jgi:mannose-1-phosphate guanylyltransferase/phosphomannomutase